MHLRSANFLGWIWPFPLLGQTCSLQSQRLAWSQILVSLCLPSNLTPGTELLKIVYTEHRFDAIFKRFLANQSSWSCKSLYPFVMPSVWLPSLPPWTPWVLWTDQMEVLWTSRIDLECENTGTSLLEFEFECGSKHPWRLWMWPTLMA